MITLIVPYYESPLMLAHQLKNWSTYGDWAKDITIVIVDDGSPTKPALAAIRGNRQYYPSGMDIRLYRIKEDIPWNYMGARNLAALEAPSGWLFSTDIDHVVPADSMEKLVSLNLKINKYYVPARYEMITNNKCKWMHLHGDSFILHKALYWDAGGYDEDFAGHYGGCPHNFIKNLDQRAARVYLDNVYHIFYNNHIIPDAHSDLLERKGSACHFSNFPDLVKKFKKAGRYVPENPIRFTWERII